MTESLEKIERDSINIYGMDDTENLWIFARELLTKKQLKELRTMLEDDFNR